jgi:GNAT superfamily N-acetyltransferase
MDSDIVIRKATVEDIPEILRQRRGMYEDMDYKDPKALAAMLSTSEVYLSRTVAEESFRGWLAFLRGHVVAGGAILLSPWPSHPYDGQCLRATILNVYTYPQHRHKGIARRLMEIMIDWCRKQQFAAVYLHASKDGRHLYEQLGFEPTNEMKLTLK